MIRYCYIIIPGIIKPSVYVKSKTIIFKMIALMYMSRVSYFSSWAHLFYGEPEKIC